MRELIFSIEHVFNAIHPEGCLAQYGCQRYHIPAYQRGYKWGSGPNGAVSVLLRDLWAAFETAASQQKKEYYLQYITVKPDAGQRQLEVIDGQQRLTTLSILISVLAALNHTPDNYSAGKLHYAIRDTLFENHIYEASKLKSFVAQSWEALIEVDSNQNKQDIYYLHAAARNIHDFLVERHQAAPTQVPEFAKYLAQHVKLIVNAVEAHVPSETVFKNLNSNKVPLTETELIKALIITRMGRTGAERRHFKEVMESRLSLGRLWDELSNWANTLAINSFYFNGAADGMHRLLELVARCLENGRHKLADKQPNKELPLFNFYNQYSDISEVTRTLKHVHAQLTDWYTDDQTYNLLGFCRFAKQAPNSTRKNTLTFLKDLLACSTKSDLQHLLTTTKAALLPHRDVSELYYGEANDEIHNILLSLSVFATGPKGSPLRFDFHEFVTHRWSLEHIFPQQPEGKDTVLVDWQKQAVVEMLGRNRTPELEQLLALDQRDEAQQAAYYEALQTGDYLNAIGNLCLLTSADNASNGCLFFPDKRRNVLKLVQRGSFVPKHTFDVFSKMMDKLVEHDPITWTVADIEAHKAYITQSISY